MLGDQEFGIIKDELRLRRDAGNGGENAVILPSFEGSIILQALPGFLHMQCMTNEPSIPPPISRPPIMRTSLCLAVGSLKQRARMGKL